MEVSEELFPKGVSQQLLKWLPLVVVVQIVLLGTPPRLHPADARVGRFGKYLGAALRIEIGESRGG